MRALAILLASAATAAPVAVEVPSGQPVSLVEVLLDENPGALWVRFRFVAPQVAREGGAVDAETAAADMDHLCESVALPYIAHHGLEVARIAISLSDRPVEFGKTVPEATQVFELYRLGPDGCIWEGM